MITRSASQSLTEFSATVSNTACRLNAERLMTLKHLRRRRLLLQRFGEFVACADAIRASNSRAFSMAMTAWAAKFVTNVDLLLFEGPNFRPARRDIAPIELVFPQHGTRQQRSVNPPLLSLNEWYVQDQLRSVGNVHGTSLRAPQATERNAMAWPKRTAVSDIRCRSGIVPAATQPNEKRHRPSR